MKVSSPRITEKVGRVLLRLVACLPYSILALKARFLRVLLQHIIRYRVSVIRNNLHNSFPELEDQQIRNITNQYYHHLAEMVLEIGLFVGNRIKPKESQRGACMVNEDPQLLETYLAKKSNLIIMMGHYGNWEWSPLPLVQAGYRILGIYKPQTDPTMDHLMKWVREKPGVKAVPMKETLRAILSAVEDGGPPFALILISDQIPAAGDIHFWTRFLNQETAFFTGGAKLARRFQLPVIYASQKKEGFGRYRINFNTLWNPGDPGDEEDITKTFVSRLEKSIQDDAHLWLWSHRRWKYQREDIPLTP